MVPPVGAPAIIAHDLRGHILGLVVLVVRHIELELLAPVPVGPKLLALAALIVADNAVGRVQNMSGAAVVLLQTDGAAVFILALKGEDVLNGGAPEFIDALVVVAHHTDIAPAAGQKGGQQILQVVCVLILVDQHILEAALPVSADLVVLLQELYREGDQIVKVHGPGGKHPAHVLAVDLPDPDPAQVAGHPGLAQVLGGGKLGVLGPADLREHGLWREGLFVQVHVLDDVLHQTLAVGGVVDGEV